MPEIVWTESAIDDLNRHYEFLKINNADAAVRAIKRMVSSAESLQENPCRGTAISQSPGLRKIFVSFDQYGYVIHYTLLGDDVIILRVYHGRENRPY